jgi:hypothetical protein
MPADVMGEGLLLLWEFIIVKAIQLRETPVIQNE